MSRYLKRLSKFLVIALVALYFLIWLLSPVIIRSVVNNYGLPKPLSLTSASSIRYNPFTAHLTISDLEIKTNEQGSALKLQSLDAQIHLHQLLFDKIYVAEFSLSGIFVPVTINEASLNIAGFELMNETPLTKEQEAEAAQPTADFPYQVIIPELTLTNAQIEIDYFSHKHNVQLNDLSLANILLSEDKHEIRLNLKSEFNDAPIEIALDGGLFQQQGKFDVNLKATDVALSSAKAFLPSSISAFDGKVSYSSQMSLNIAKHHTSAEISDLLLLIEDLYIEQDDLLIEVENQQIQAKNTAILVQPNTPISINTSLDYVANGMVAKSTANEALLADISQLTVDGLTVDYQQDIPKINVSRIQFNDSKFSENQHIKMPALAAFKQLVLTNIIYDPELIAVDSITLSGLLAHILLDKEKGMATLVKLNSKVAKNDEDLNKPSQTADNTVISNEASLEETEKSAKLVFKLVQFTFLDEAVINFSDRSVTPSYERDLIISQLSLSDIDSSKPEQEVLFSMKGKSDKYASLDVKGNGFPFAAEQKFSVDATVKELSLPGVSSYIKNALKYEIESGQLDIKIKAGLTGTQLNGDVDLLLRGIEFTAADDHETGTIVDQTSVPFNIALGMLKDSDGNVELSVPLAGDTSAPSFGFSGFLTLLVKQATMSAAKDYLITTFVPYASVMKVAMAAGEFALKLRINDLNYQPGETALSAEQLEFSRQMSVMLADRENINVKLCAIATASDIELADASQAHQAENITRLKAISQQRVEIFKAHMVEELNVPSAKLLFCTPQIDSAKGAKGRIKFVI